MINQLRQKDTQQSCWIMSSVAMSFCQLGETNLDSFLDRGVCCINPVRRQYLELWCIRVKQRQDSTKVLVTNLSKLKVYIDNLPQRPPN